MPININIPRTPPFLRSPDPNTPKKREVTYKEEAHQACLEAIRSERERTDRCMIFAWDHTSHTCVDMYGFKLDGLTIDEMQRRPTIDKIWSKKLDPSCFHTSTTPCKCGRLGMH
ncbi:hypothetical protein CLAFUW4_03469 [Fulvia fulva]|uniref:Uncharacterized protein n=1 Tax=Passalora fulva TaxID=5499 RepID=A0A9Q8L9J5_PASFU|nr:uncharacterized protein CLAFUR5_03448 [Fulvia fulva]KAK4632411.1 hypothetical protein CLAFUR4_03458 [Fulvia fulva]KAK4633775.1 hypothetical protein CLAFUR0_03463 [Fulvia fulva]UJO13209.1 hypothetical protein CLAFUR5_03448 [Fulvia fulva]WPV11554.1 hypothetical protein CLAFUW4_03469 [Fulvia fulva]WPV26710.1 hypothetical protein CLAFUW7_03461 [Fulvia fulva]